MAAEVAVVGGGLAGTAAAILLARAGHQVRLFEKEKSPHHKVCGEFLSGECIAVIEKLGVDLDRLGAHPIRQVKLHSRQRFVASRLPFTGKSVSRKVLEECLLDRARELGVKIEWGMRVTGYQRRNSRFLIERKEYSALFWASGKYDVATVQKRLGRENSAVGFKIHCRLSPALTETLLEAIELHLYDGGYAGLSLVENQVVNFCCIVDKVVYKKLGSWQNLLAYQMQDNPRLRNIFTAVEWLWPKPLSIANIPYGFQRRPGVDGGDVFFLGDQFAVIPSLAGDGMAIALLSAERAVQSFLTDAGLATAVKIYQRQMQSMVASPMRISYVLHEMSRSPRLAGLALKLLKPFPRVVEKLVEKTRSDRVPQT